MALYVDIIVDISVNSLDRPFQYSVPESLCEEVAIGRQVTVPFGAGNRQLQGFIIGVSDTPKFDVARTKDILSIESEHVAVEGQLIALAKWIQMRYGSTMIQALKTVLPVKKTVKEVRHITYTVKDSQLAENLLQKARKLKNQQARVRFLEAILRENQLSQETVKSVLEVSVSVIKTLLKTGAIEEEVSQVYRNPIANRIGGWREICLNQEQHQVVEAIWQSERPIHLIHGITGSGKTEVYMALMERVIASGRQVIVLIPEISLTLQTVSRFYERFGNQIVIMNSKLSAGEKYDQTLRARRGDASIMIGPRSALFTPFEKLGMIIIDEEHESSYKSETMPRYHAVDVAIERAKMAGAKVVLGSATPSLTSYTKALEGVYELHRLRYRAKANSRLPDVQIVDLREEFRMRNRSILSEPLRAAMEDCLKQGEQMMLFINRRGFAGFVSCRSCGYVMKCEHCDVSLTLHGSHLKCHYCGYETEMPKVCPSCGSPYIAGFGVGTEKVQSFIEAEFPQARVLRMDKDTTSGKDNMSKILTTFAEGDADILVGTQMIVKGHDFPNVTLVGILAADLSMFSGDYLSSERTFQLLTQAAGRAGRDQKPGKVIIQTYQPDNYCIQTAAAQDYEAFYRQEILYRQLLRYPPKYEMLMLLCEGRDEEETKHSIQTVKQLIDTSEEFEGIVVIGPTKARISKAKDMYRYVLYMKHEKEEQLIAVRIFVEGYLEWSNRFTNIYFNFDLNPVVLL